MSQSICRPVSAKKNSVTRRFIAARIAAGLSRSGFHSSISGGADRDIAAGNRREMIIVIPDANTLRREQYSSFPTTGDWEAYITQDLFLISTVTIARLPPESGGWADTRWADMALADCNEASEMYGPSTAKPLLLMNNPQPPAQNRRPRPAPAPIPDYVDITHARPPPGHESKESPLFFDLPVKEACSTPCAARWVATLRAMIYQYIPNIWNIHRSRWMWACRIPAQVDEDFMLRWTGSISHTALRPSKVTLRPPERSHRTKSSAIFYRQSGSFRAALQTLIVSTLSMIQINISHIHCCGHAGCRPF